MLMLKSDKKQITFVGIHTLHSLLLAIKSFKSFLIPFEDFIPDTRGQADVRSNSNMIKSVSSL